MMSVRTIFCFLCTITGHQLLKHKDIAQRKGTAGRTTPAQLMEVMFQRTLQLGSQTYLHTTCNENQQWKAAVNKEW